MIDFHKSADRHLFPVLTWFVVFVTLVGCTTAPRVPTSLTASRSGDGKLADQFSLAGRISVRVGDKIDSGQIRWQRGVLEERIGLYSPLGSQVAELVSDKTSGAATLRQGKEIRTAASVAELTQSLLSVPLDLDRLALWVQGQGLLENQNVNVEFANGDQWQVTAESFRVVGKYQFASRVIAISKDIVVRLVVDEWLPE